MGIILEQLHVAIEGTPPSSIAAEDPYQALLELQRHLPEIEPVARARGELHLETVAVVVGVFLQRLDQQEVHRHPHRPTPVGIAPKHCHRAVRRAVGQDLAVGALGERIGMVPVHLGQGANPIGGKKLLLIEQPLADPPQAVFWHEGIENAVVIPSSEILLQPAGGGALVHKPGQALSHIQHWNTIHCFAIETRYSEQGH